MRIIKRDDYYGRFTTTHRGWRSFNDGENYIVLDMCSVTDNAMYETLRSRKNRFTGYTAIRNKDFKAPVCPACGFPVAAKAGMVSWYFYDNCFLCGKEVEHGGET